MYVHTFLIFKDGIDKIQKDVADFLGSECMYFESRFTNMLELRTVEIPIR